MRLQMLRTWFLAAACLAGLEGCRSASERLPYARDPLLLSKRPVRGAEGREKPFLLAVAEPEPPPLSPSAFVALPPASRIGHRSPALITAAPSPAEPGKFPLTSTKSVMGTLMPRVKTGAPLQALAVSLVRSPVAYGHAANFSWVQGVLERSKPGHWLLRYTDSPGEDLWDGRLQLKDDSRLDALCAGDSVEMEGDMIALPTDSTSLPTYRMDRVIKLARN